MADDRTRTVRVEAQFSDEDNRSSLNFQVTPEFKKEFKGYAVSQGITMIDLLKEGFALPKKQRGQ